MLIKKDLEFCMNLTSTIDFHLSEECLDLLNMLLSSYYSNTDDAAYSLYELVVLLSISKPKNINPIQQTSTTITRMNELQWKG